MGRAKQAAGGWEQGSFLCLTGCGVSCLAAAEKGTQLQRQKEVVQGWREEVGGGTKTEACGAEWPHRLSVLNSAHFQMKPVNAT